MINLYKIIQPSANVTSLETFWILVKFFIFKLLIIFNPKALTNSFASGKLAGDAGFRG